MCTQVRLKFLLCMAIAKEINTKLITARKGKISPEVRKNAMAILPVYMMFLTAPGRYGPSLKIIQVLIR